MTTIDIIICTVNRRIACIPEILLPCQEGVHYIVSLQITDKDRNYEIPENLQQREDVTVVSHYGKGLSKNRNEGLKYSESDLVYFIDDDTRILDGTINKIRQTFDDNKDIDIAFFQVSTYTGKGLKQYSATELSIKTFREIYYLLTPEMVCRKSKIKNKLFFNEYFGLGADYLSCYEQQLFTFEAIKSGLVIKYFPLLISSTSSLFANRLIFVDHNVQRSLGALLYSCYGMYSYYKAIYFAISATNKGMSHFIPLLTHLFQGIKYIKNIK